MLDSGVLGVAVAACERGLGTIKRAMRIETPTVNVVHVVRMVAPRMCPHSEKRKLAVSERVMNRQAKEPRAIRLCLKDKDPNRGEV